MAGSKTSITVPSTAPWEPRRWCAGKKISITCARFPPAPICGVSSSTASTGWCGATPPSCCTVASTKLPLLWRAAWWRCALTPSSKGGPVEVWWEGKLQASARPLDAVVNGQLPSPQPASPPAPQPTGINFVELVHHNKPENKPESEEEDAPW